MDGEIEPARLAALLEDGEAPLLVDIRPPRPFRAAHIPGSVNLPLRDLTGDVEVVDGADRVVTVCPHGEASVQAARLVAAYEGFDGTVESLAGGLDAWDGPLAQADPPADETAETGTAESQPDAPF